MTETQTTTQYPPPPAHLIEDIRKRLAKAPRDVSERVDEALKHQSIEQVANFLWRAGHPFTTSELYEYRRTLFPPDAMVDPYTAGPPVLRNADVSPPPPTTFDPSVGRGACRDEASERRPVPAEPPTGRVDARHAEASERRQVPACLPSDDGRTTDNGPVATANGQGTTDHGLLNDLRDVIKRYVVLPEMATETLALWIVHTYAFTLRQVTTYIGVVSPEKRCGKTTLLELLGLLANRSLTAANISPSALFRVIEETRPTLLIDEADTFLQGRDELAGILNAGYRKGNAYVVRVAERKPRRSDEQQRQPEFGEWTNERPDGSPGATEFAQYSCWCPKVMAAIGRLPDTLADRCIVITMQRKMPGEKCERMRHLNAADYRRRCAEFVREHSEAIAQARPATLPGLNDRAADIWEPLLAIADLAGGEWPQLAREAAQQLSASDDEITLVGYFLKDLRNYMVLKKVDRMLSREIVAAFNPMHDRPWEDLRRGREINEWWLGWQMRELGIRSKYLRLDDTVARGYVLEDIEAAFRRYVPNPDAHSVPKPEPSEIPNAKS